MPKVVCTSLMSQEGPHFEILRSAGFDVELVPEETNLFREETLIEVLSDADAVLAGAEPYTQRVIEALPKLRAICRTGVGYDAIDLEACNRAGIVVTITPGVNHHAVAEMTIALLMGVARGFPETDRQVREGRWKRVIRPRVMGSTLGLVGLGRIGRAVAWRAIGLGLKVLACEPSPPQEFVEQMQIELVGFDELLARSDYVSLHLPMSKENHHLMNAETFAKMKEGSVLINTSRGGLVDETALCAALRSGRLRAAGLDVFETEPLPLESPLLEFPNVLLAGHVAGLDTQSHYDTFKMAAETIIDLHGGGWPEWCIVNADGLSEWKW